MGFSRKQVLILFVALSAVFMAHLLGLETLPRGLYLDETSIGLNAASIAASGVDEYGESWPIYFRAFGEYKNPVYIYVSAAIFKVAGVSAYGLRFTSFVFYALSLVFFLLLINKLFPRNFRVLLFALITFGFLPQLFVLSRISFEVISQATWLSASIYLLWLTFESNLNNQLSQDRIKRFLYGFLTGFILGTSVYTYSTARLLSFLMFFSVLLCYFSKDNLKYLVTMVIGLAVGLIPYLIFSLEVPGSMIVRFFQISYVDDPIPLFDKVFLFIRNYCIYWSPNFLLMEGDTNLRHSIGYGGVIFFTTFSLAICGVASLLNCRILQNRFSLFILLNTLFAPIAAALTEQGTPHALRSLPVGFFCALLSCYGFAWLCKLDLSRLKLADVIGRGELGKLELSREVSSDVEPGRTPFDSLERCSLQPKINSVVFAILLFEVCCYIFVYAIFYPERSITANQTYGLAGALQTAIKRSPQRIVFVPAVASSYANINFYRYSIDNPTNIPIVLSKTLEPKIGDCIIYTIWSETLLRRVGTSIYYQGERLEPNALASRLGVPARDYITRLRCY
ncbi:ArnT family glycosyltransferase [Teredinibacter waterburyi]|jgi:hypothetical protein|uniref:ArnT family glycosyltransferase n=1 Tax=Teredinibacter waterburyi TaxID=1500538 RepID=UPI00165F1F9E|nr:hypothetical protein [Teredinibacter waterburyi]